MIAFRRQQNSLLLYRMLPSADFSCCCDEAPSNSCSSAQAPTPTPARLTRLSDEGLGCYRERRALADCQMLEEVCEIA